MRFPLCITILVKVRSHHIYFPLTTHIILCVFYCQHHLHSIEDSAGLFAGTVLFLVVWAILCSFGAQELRGLAAATPGGAAEQWLDDIESCKNAVSIIGTLFVFTLVFRFNACYDRWWESRIFWVSCTKCSFKLCIFSTCF